MSKYFSNEIKPPANWTAEEFWWAVEQLEKYGDENSLFDLSLELDIKYDEHLRGKTSIPSMIDIIIREGGDKDKVVEAIKKFVKKRS